jgi:hypothetical protein
MLVKVDEDDLLEMLMERVEYWTYDWVVNALFRQMYESYISCGAFEGMELDIPQIVDNDYVNNCNVVGEGDDGYEELLKVYEEQGLGDCSCEGIGYDYIEAYESNTFLVRW